MRDTDTDVKFKQL